MQYVIYAVLALAVIGGLYYAFTRTKLKDKYKEVEDRVTDRRDELLGRKPDAPVPTGAGVPLTVDTPPTITLPPVTPPPSTPAPNTIDPITGLDFNSIAYKLTFGGLTQAQIMDRIARDAEAKAQQAAENANFDIMGDTIGGPGSIRDFPAIAGKSVMKTLVVHKAGQLFIAFANRDDGPSLEERVDFTVADSNGREVGFGDNARIQASLHYVGSVGPGRYVARITPRLTLDNTIGVTYYLR